MSGEHRSLDDRMGEAMRRSSVGLVQPLWADMTEDSKADWIERVRRFKIVGDKLDFFTADKAKPKRKR